MAPLHGNRLAILKANELFSLCLLLQITFSCDGSSKPPKDAPMAEQTPKDAAIAEPVANAAQRKEHNSMKPTLVLRFSPAPRMQVGYGNTFLCQIEEVKSGEFSEETFMMTVLATDRKTYESLQSHINGTSVTGKFVLDKENVPYSMMPITGFVDKDMRTWKLLELE